MSYKTLMPLYEYRCPQGHIHEKQRPMQKRKDPLPCETCGQDAQLILSRTNFALKGGGWYADGYADPNKGTS